MHAPEPLDVGKGLGLARTNLSLHVGGDDAGTYRDDPNQVTSFTLLEAGGLNPHVDRSLRCAVAGPAGIRVLACPRRQLHQRGGNVRPVGGPDDCVTDHLGSGAVEQHVADVTGSIDFAGETNGREGGSVVHSHKLLGRHSVDNAIEPFSEHRPAGRITEVGGELVLGVGCRAITCGNHGASLGGSGRDAGSNPSRCSSNDDQRGHRASICVVAPDRPDDAEPALYPCGMTDVVRQTFPLGPQWPTIDPFLFVAHHHDSYPAGNESFGPDAPLTGRSIGQDFSGTDGWSMYHGDVVPGFPQHPHRGFETVTYVRQGFIDHSDSLGATARFGQGDTQWMTAGAGIQHCEMFPLLDRNGPNPLELFQIWLNLPAADKMVSPYFTMLWSHRTPTVIEKDAEGRRVEVTVVAGQLGDQPAAPPPPDSWAAKAEADVAIWHLAFESDAEWTLPATVGPSTERVLYVFEGSMLTISGSDVPAGTGALIEPNVDIVLRGGNGPVAAMLLQGRPIGEPVVQHGPFVMNTSEEIQQAFQDYQQTQFGDWPWDGPAPHHAHATGRFARHTDGTVETIDGTVETIDGTVETIDGTVETIDGTVEIINEDG
ncbi:MAG: redox-sensitive bicupin YhaK (pirin superfamily) [Acidimicrobiales bacterium]|jgi:redox-sensitive bicupin YhaK (pirin superfamily)